MSFKEEYIYWSFINQLITKKGYRFISASTDQQEIWLENQSSRIDPLIRIKREDLDWSNNMKRDRNLVLQNAEKIRRFLSRKELTVKTIYVSQYAPVDDYSDVLGRYSNESRAKITIDTMIFQTEAMEESLTELESFLGFPLEVVNRDYEFIEENEINHLKEDALAASYQKQKQDEQIFSHGKPIFTYLLMAIQVLVFILLEMRGGSTNTETLIQFGAKYNPLIMEGEWWRFFTPIFLHIGFTHLILNTLSLYFVGVIVERIYGSLRFLVIYFFAGFIGSVASFILMPNLSAGASGAIFGLLGALLLFGILHPNLFFRTMGWNVIVILAINLVITFSADAIDSAGHIGGLIGGFLAATIVRLPKNPKLAVQMGALLLTVLLTIGALVYGYSSNESDHKYHNDVTLAHEYVNSKEYAKAYELIEGYLKEEDAPEAYFLAGYIKYHQYDLKAAETYFLKAIEQQEVFPEAYYDIGLLYWQLGQIDKAKDYIQIAVYQEPDNEDYKTTLNELDSE
ncbi:rhomboid family intramembrane serine protease [Bacillus sp. FJAT-27986]|uniref:rhomboid family intramembrane serine protease n=1 Tax=Bacillus sp. FJAT-27986 TaxID=1743146 RepID=UPI00080AD0B5|nr:rhomboid family intramembrane serine protease [Bacillus sp. FJAT-27986]OCA86391.1 hypothetical protein A8L44_08280 [Bacillus sp. FJAT-27986]